MNSRRLQGVANRHCRPSRKALAFAFLGLLAVTGCPRTRPGPQTASPADPNVLLVYVACALVPTLQAAAAEFQQANPGKSLQIQADEPGELVSKIESGAQPDVFICLGRSEAGLLEREGYLDTGWHREVGEHRLVLATPAAKPGPESVQELASSGVASVIMAAPGITSLGTDGKRALERAGVWAKIQAKLVLRATPLQAIQGLAKGEADVGVTYTPCPLLELPGKIAPDSIAFGTSLAPYSERPARVQISMHKRTQKTELARQLIVALSRSKEWTKEPPAAPEGEGEQ